ncbi:hypothetical protein HHI36_022550 [Cryptolaemus montrouzieri]|uniref:Uncharacterized protein n=1 Tax=Cryptolaemus montrouzieri TaxID=559131 RepID=A0ABD2MZY3_9CUCU
MNSAEKIQADVAFLNAPTERLEGVLRNKIAALSARGNNISDIRRYSTTANNASLSNFRTQSDDDRSEEEDFKLPRNTVKRMRKSEKTLKIETRNQFENLMEEDIDEDHRPTEEEDKQVEGTRVTKTTTKSPAKYFKRSSLEKNITITAQMRICSLAENGKMLHNLVLLEMDQNCPRIYRKG